MHLQVYTRPLAILTLTNININKICLSIKFFFHSNPLLSYCHVFFFRPLSSFSFQHVLRLCICPCVYFFTNLSKSAKIVLLYSPLMSLASTALCHFLFCLLLVEEKLVKDGEQRERLVFRRHETIFMRSTRQLLEIYSFAKLRMVVQAVT